MGTTKHANQTILALVISGLMISGVMAAPGWGGKRQAVCQDQENCQFQPGAGQRAGQSGERGDLAMRWLAQLELDEAQQSAINKLLEQVRNEREAQRTANLEQHQLFLSGNLDAKQLLAQREAQREASQLARMQLEYAIHQELTPEQQAKVNEMRSQGRFAMRGAGRGGKGGKGQRQGRGMRWQSAPSQ